MTDKFDKLKRSLSVALAVLIALLASSYLKLPEKYWVPITTLLVMQTAIGVIIRHGARRYLIIVAGIVVSTIIALGVKSSFWMMPVAIVLFGLCCYYSKRDTLNYSVLSGPFLLGLIFLIALLVPAQPILYQRLYAVTVGAGIAILANLIIFPVHPDVEFRQKVISVLRSYSEYLRAIFHLLYKDVDALKLVASERDKVEEMLLAQSVYFPVWVYEPGVVMALRQGHRHFLIMVERIAQTLFSMHHEARYEFDPVLLEDLKIPLEDFIRQVENIINALIAVMNLNRLSEGQSDLEEEIIVLEKSFKTAVPLPLEVLDISPEYIYLAAFVANAKDLRAALINLGGALRYSV